MLDVFNVSVTRAPDSVAIKYFDGVLTMAGPDARSDSLALAQADSGFAAGDRLGAQLDDIAFYEAFAHFKFAVIAQGIAARVAAGSMAGQDFGNLDQEVLKIAEEGLSRLEED